VLVSGGFTYFTEPIAAKLGFHVSHGNTLDIRSGRLTGKVCDPILDHQAKLFLLQHYQTAAGLDSTETLAIGDGANDLAMIQAAGLGVGYHPKPFLKERVQNNIIYGDLTALLYAQGYDSF
jgi:phosphoserine phosphatase